MVNLVAPEELRKKIVVIKILEYRTIFIYTTEGASAYSNENGISERLNSALELFFKRFDCNASARFATLDLAANLILLLGRYLSLTPRRNKGPIC